jgi:flavin reductase (DIM6/NTAB) family NADH-FMN oxidoreductase RutF
MFYDTAKNDHGLPRDPFKAIVAPRPIGWITSMSANGEINLAPYSFFNAVSDAPPIVLFSSEGPKDSLVFVEQTREFVCNLATWELRDAMNKTSAPFERGVNEMERAGRLPAPASSWPSAADLATLGSGLYVERMVQGTADVYQRLDSMRRTRRGSPAVQPGRG